MSWRGENRLGFGRGDFGGGISILYSVTVLYLSSFAVAIIHFPLPLFG